MSLNVALLLLMLAAQCWTNPQRRNWTPQAILYLKGAQGHRSASKRISREENIPLDSVTYSQIGAGVGQSPESEHLLELLLRAVEGGEASSPVMSPP